MTLSSLGDYGKSFQLRVLGALLTDKSFLQTTVDIIKEEYWNSSAHKWIISKVVSYWREYHTVPTMEVLQVEYKKIDNDVLKVAVREELKSAYKTLQDDLEYVKEEFTNFCRNQEMKNAILESTDLLKHSDYEGIRGLIERALKAGQNKGIGHEYKKDVETRYREDYRPTIPTPWEPINKIYAGGLGPGDLFLIFGGPGTGKSWLSIAIAAYAVSMGYNVIYYTLELGEDYVSRRFDSYLTGYPVDECPQHRAEIDELMQNLTGNLVVKEYAPKTASISTIEAHIQQCTDEDCKPDLIIIDYGDYLRPPGKSRFSERKDEIDDVYIGMKSLAKRLGVPIISPSQVNRAGAKDSVVEGDKAAGSYDKLAVSDGSISLSRMKEDKVLGTGRIHIMKSRYGGDGTTFEIKFDSSNGHVEFEEEVALDPVASPNSPSVAYHLDKDVIAKFFNES